MDTSNIWQDRKNAIVNSIMSGNNACGTLQKALAEGRLNVFIRRMIQPTLRVCAEEAAELRQQRDAALKLSERRRLALANITANCTLPPPMAAEAEGLARVGV